MKMDTPFELESLVLAGVKLLVPNIRNPIIEIEKAGDKVSVYHQAWLRESDGDVVRINRGLSFMDFTSVGEALAAGKGH